MKKFIYTIILILSAALVFSACSREKLETAQYSDSEVTLASFGPNPVMRGATLCFYGSNLDRVTAVNVPGVSPITSIEVIATGKTSEIRVQLPAENEEPGVVTLTTADGRTLTTQTELTYSEPIVFDSFSVEKKGDKAMPGDKISFKGDYMNLVQFVTFEGGEKVAVTGIDRYNAYASIPHTAITGKVILSDGGTIENLLYSKEDLVIGKPTVSTLTYSSGKPDSAAVISGEYLSMIAYITFEGGKVLECSSMIISGDVRNISFRIPETAQTGDVIATSYAGDEFVAGKLEMILPTELNAAPKPIKAGKTLTITGKNLDIVTGIDFPNSPGATLTYSYDTQSITADVPAAAQEGDITLSMDNGDQVTVPYTLVHPTVTEITPTELYAGDNITVTGTDLDLVTGVTLGGKDVEFKADSETQLTVTTANTSVSGKMVFTLANGETVEPETEITLSYHSLVIVNSMPSAQHIGSVVTLKGENFMKIENIFIGEAKVTDYTFRSDTLVSFIMPYNPVGTYSVYFDLLNGDRETCPQTIEVQLELVFTTIWEGSWTCAEWGGNQDLAWGAFDWSTVSAGDKVRFYLTPTVAEGNWWCVSLRHGDSWGALPNPPIPGQYDTPGTLLEVEFTQTVLDDIIAHNGLVITGTGYTLTKVEVTHTIPQEKAIWEGSWTCSEWGGNQDLAWGAFDWSTVSAGDAVKFYLTPTVVEGDWWCVSLRHGDSWGALPNPPIPGQYDAPGSLLEVEFTQTVLDDIIAHNGLVITGTGYTLTKVTVPIK